MGAAAAAVRAAMADQLLQVGEAQRSTYLAGQNGEPYLAGETGEPFLAGQNDEAHLAGQNGEPYLAGQNREMHLAGQNDEAYLAGQTEEAYLAGQNGEPYLAGQNPESRAFGFQGGPGVSRVCSPALREDAQPYHQEFHVRSNLCFPPSESPFLVLRRGTIFLPCIFQQSC